jgi:MSHA biogenesis protein MshP
MKQRAMRIEDRKSGIPDPEFRSVPGCCQRGFSLISAIFLLVVIAVLGMFAVTLFTGQQQGETLDMLGARAYQASRAGIEWGAYQILTPGTISCNTYAAPNSNNVALTAPGLQNFTVTVACGSLAVSEAGATVTIYQLTSTATQGNADTPNYVERQIKAAIAK